jgi:hypothetical protein
MRAENAGTMRVLDLIRKHKPSVIRVTMSDGETKEVEVRGGRSRWSPAARTVAAYGWARIELLGAKGAVLHVADNDAASADPEPAGPTEARELHLLRIMNAHADLAVQRHIEALKPTLMAMQAQVNMLAEQLVAERREAARTMESAADLAEQLTKMARAAQESGQEGGGDLMQMLQMMPALMKMLPADSSPSRVVVQPRRRPAAGRPPGVPAPAPSVKTDAPPA